MDHQYSKNFALYFDMLRSKRQLTQEQFVDGIISLRQYRRYLRGESMLSQLIINAFCEKLGFKPEHIMLDFENDRHKESTKVFQFYNAFANKNIALANQLKSEIDASFIMNKDNKLMYQFTLFLYALNDKKITQIEFIEQTKNLIGYDALIKKEILSSIELIVLSVFLDMKTFQDKEVIVNKLQEVLKNERKVITENQHSIQNLCFVRLAKHYGLNKLYTKSLEICHLAIERSIERLSINLLDYFYYFNSLNYHYLGNKDKHEESLFKCYAVLKAQDNPSKYTKFKKLIEEDYKINLEDFIVSYIQKQKNT